MLSTWTHEELCKPIRNQERNQKKHSMEEKEKEKERERKLKKSTWKIRNQRIVDQRIVDSVDVLHDQ
jgi:hypothetical protein